jgi:hypothetical protein
MRDRGRRASAIATLTLAAAAALAGVLASSARGEGVTREKLDAHGWTCVEFLPANRWSCFNPGTGRPIPGDPDPKPSYSFLGFDRTSGEFLYTGHLIRQDLYSGQPCAPGGEPYVLRSLIGYYECVRLAGVERTPRHY